MPDPASLRPSAGPGAARSEVFNLANIITFARLCAVPVAIWLVLHERLLAGFWLFIAAGLSDALDGWLARRRGVTHLGALMDPVADKALLVGMYVTLAVVQVLPDWLAMLVVFRDVVIVGGVLALNVTGHKVAIRPLRISKVNTLLQITLVAASLLLAGHGLIGQSLVGGGTIGAHTLSGLAAAVWLPLVWLVAASTLLSGAAYVLQTARST
jgi:cardiolipin synthase